MNHMKTTNYSKLAIRIYEGKLTLQQVYKASFQLGVEVEREYVKLLSTAITAEVNKVAIAYAVQCGVEAVDKLRPLTDLMEEWKIWSKDVNKVVHSINNVKGYKDYKKLINKFDSVQKDTSRILTEAFVINTENIRQLENVRFILGVKDKRLIALEKFSGWVGNELDEYQKILNEYDRFVESIEPYKEMSAKYLVSFDDSYLTDVRKVLLFKQVTFLRDFSKYYNKTFPSEEYKSLLKQYEQYRKFKGGK